MLTHMTLMHKAGITLFVFIDCFLALWLQIWAAEQVRCLFNSYCTEQYVRQCHPGRTGVSKSSCLIVFEEQRKSPLMFIWNNRKRSWFKKVPGGAVGPIVTMMLTGKISSHTEMTSTCVSGEELRGALQGLGDIETSCEKVFWSHFLFSLILL